MSGRGGTGIRVNLKRNMRGNQKNKDYKVKWSPELAYVVGLIATDGSLSIDRRHISITSNDTQLLDTAKKCLKINNRITPKSSGFTGKKTCHHIQFGNIVLYKWLVNIGLIPNKTWLLRSLKIPNKYFFDFLRGHLDGDGSIRTFMDPVYPNSRRLYVSFNSASLLHIKWLREKIKNLANITGFVMKNRTIFCLSYAKKESVILLSYLYPNRNIFFLKRKYKIAKQFLSPGGEIGKHASFRS